MVSVVVVEGGQRLQGQIRASGAKNAALPILFATLLAPGEHRLANVPQLNDSELMDLFTEAGAPCPTRIKWFEGKSAKSSSGIMEFDTAEEATEALIIVNNVKMDIGEVGRPYDVKLCFSKAGLDRDNERD